MRTDLLALTDDALITLANRGIVKRALKENAAAPPQLDESPDGTVTAVFADGVRTTLPRGVTVDAAPCSCGATTTCRHRVATVMAYRDRPPTGDLPPASPGDAGSPGDAAAGGHPAATAPGVRSAKPLVTNSTAPQANTAADALLSQRPAGDEAGTPASGRARQSMSIPVAPASDRAGDSAVPAMHGGGTPLPPGHPDTAEAPIVHSDQAHTPTGTGNTVPSDRPTRAVPNRPGAADPGPRAARPMIDRAEPRAASPGAAGTVAESGAAGGTDSTSDRAAAGSRPGDRPDATGSDATRAGDPRSAVDVEGAASEPTRWSPGQFGDEEMRQRLGARGFAAAVRARRAGYRATVRRATAADPVPSVELPSVTVRFLVPGDLGYARADAARGARTEAIALAVWAFRVADTTDPDAGEMAVTVGEPGDATPAVTAAAAVSVPLADLLDDGVAHAGTGLPGVFAAARRELDRARARWPFDALDELLDQLSAYRERNARHDPLRTAALVAELVARRRAAVVDPVSALGTEEAAETPLRHLRLTGLGARAYGDDENRGVEVYLAHPEARLVLTAVRAVTVESGATAPQAAELGARRTGSVRFTELAAGHVVTESAVRSANRRVRLANSRVARTSVLPSTGAWDALPPELLVGDLAAESARLAALPPAPIRPRVHGASVRAMIVETVDDLHYLPGEQRLVARLRGPAGTARITFSHSAIAPGALDALARALAGDPGPVRYLAGRIERRGGLLVVEPTAVVAGESVVVPCFAAGESTWVPESIAVPPDPLADAVSAGLALTAEVVHRGVRHLPPSWFERAASTAAVLRRAGLAAAAEAVDRLCPALRAATGVTALEQWADVHLRLQVTAEQL
ncbi:hypothetical protein [Nocardia sp. alder85J]|uniref:hypothetical protein n=1 Tax=Nocardia sp. alder85J TaxID=2862949 RepID=UPI001CD52EC3|nr:hypothetical protein [Nocardia sp. alder85J]MCX4094889.1 hypothetical protein [Nocardia sp. alder85J]